VPPSPFINAAIVLAIVKNACYGSINESNSRQSIYYSVRL
jgi:hypothetical protein